MAWQPDPREVLLEEVADEGGLPGGVLAHQEDLKGQEKVRTG